MSTRLRWVVAATLAVAAASVAAAQTFSIAAYVMSVGTSVRSSGPCYRLQATIGEAAPGNSASATYAIAAGFRYTTANLGDDSVFFSGFEDCTP